MRWALLLAAILGCGDDIGGGGGSDGAGGAGGSGGTDGGVNPDGAPPPATTCALPIMPADVSNPTTVVRTCTQAGLAAAIAQGGVITFDCGGPATIPITSQIELPIDRDTVIDGGGMITLDGGGTTRILRFNSLNYRATRKTVTLQHLAFRNAHSTGTMIPQAPPPCSQGYDLDAGGAAIFVRDGILHVIDVTFQNNQGASPGPDVAGGGVYAIGSLEVIIVGSRFVGNSASNGGAVGSLNSNLTLVDDVFDQNQATGTGANYIDPSCTVNGGESGNGGNGGAVVIDGGSDGMVVACGNVFRGNSGGALGGAIFRTPDIAQQTTQIDQSTFDGNHAKNGGAAYFHNSALVVTATTFSNNTAEGSGAIQADGTQLDFTNVTLAGNHATMSLGGAMAIFSGGGSIVNCTFANNLADGGSGLFAAAIAGGATFTIRNTLFQNNTTADAGSPMQCQQASTGSADLQWPRNHVVGGSPDTACVTGIQFADANLGALADNGGPTKTLSPGSGSPAIGLGTNCPATDQRGHSRPTTGCTAGAVEAP